MKKWILLLLVVTLLFAGCTPALPQAEATEPPTQAPTAEATQPPTEPPTETPTEPPTEPPVDLSWLAPERQSVSYEAFFAGEGVNAWYEGGYSVKWTQENPDFGVIVDDSYSLRRDEEGLYVRRNEKKSPVKRDMTYTCVYRVPDTKELGAFAYAWHISLPDGATKEQYLVEFLCDGHNALSFREDGTFVQIDLLTGARKETKLAVPDGKVLEFHLVHPDVIYLTMMHSDHGALYRLYIPSMTVDVLYDEIPAGMPIGWLEIFPTFNLANPNQGKILFKYLNPEFLDILNEVLADKESHYMDSEMIPAELWEEDALNTFCGARGYLALNLFERIEEDYGVAYQVRIEYDFGAQQVVNYEILDLSQRWE